MLLIRRLNPGEAALYRSLRLEALRDSPQAFATTLEAAWARDDASWAAQADASAQGGDRATFIALQDGQALAMAALYRDAGDPAAGELLQMWVAPPHRGGALSGALLDHLLHWAGRHAFTVVRAEITRGNLRAGRFYRKHGFEPLSPDPECLVFTKAVSIA
jgi:GNAT superfamily N-acetyltransferase